MKDFLFTLWSGFVFIILAAVLIFIGLGIVILIGTLIPEPIIIVCVSIFVIWFVGAVIS